MIKKLFKNDILSEVIGVEIIDSEEKLVRDFKRDFKKFVITNEVQKVLKIFFENYLNNFEHIDYILLEGPRQSGKTFLLKILYYIFKDFKIDNKSFSELFISEIKDSELKKTIKKSISIPNEIILFNIHPLDYLRDFKNTQSLLRAFIKHFNKHLGYAEQFGFIAEIEKDLEKKDLFIKFQNNFKKYSGTTWNKVRNLYFIEEDNFIKALSDTYNISIEEAKLIIDKYRKNYKASFENFSQDINNYINSKSKNFRLIFLIDKIEKCLSNFRTLEEFLILLKKINILTQGKVLWVFAINKNFLKYIKIKNRNLNLKISYSNIIEVLQKRFLSKKSKYYNDLKYLYNKLPKILKYKYYKNFKSFYINYPFVPFQYNLIIKSLKTPILLYMVLNLKEISQGKIGTIFSFDKFYKKYQYQSEKLIDKAEKCFSDKFVIKVLKVLVEINNMKFDKTIENISLLLINDVAQNFNELKIKVKNALNLLMSYGFIKKKNNNYFIWEEPKIEENRKTKIFSKEVEDKKIDRLYCDEIKEVENLENENRDETPYILIIRYYYNE